MDGGVIGIALIINYLFGAKVGLVMILCSVPLFTLSWFYNRDIMFSSLQGLLISSWCIYLLEPYQGRFHTYLQLGPVSSSLLGGFIVGSGIGIMLKYETSTGGTDLLAQFLSKLTSTNAGILIFIIDGIIIGLGGLFLSVESFFFSIITISAGGLATSLILLK